MSNTVKSCIEVHDSGKLTVEDVNMAVHGVHPLPTIGYEGVNYYSASQREDSEWIEIRTKWSAPVGAIAHLACEKGLNLSMEFDSADNSEIGSVQLCYRRVAPEEYDPEPADHYHPEAVPRAVRDVFAKYARKQDEDVRRRLDAIDQTPIFEEEKSK